MKRYCSGFLLTWGTVIRLLLSTEFRLSFPIPLECSPRIRSRTSALFAAHASPLSDVIHDNDDVMHMMYADDMQLYIVLKKNDASSGISKLSRCGSDVKSLPCGNNLAFNGIKTEVIHITSMFCDSSVLPDLGMDGTSISLSKSAKDLGVTVDNVLNVKQDYATYVVSQISGSTKLDNCEKS